MNTGDDAWAVFKRTTNAQRNGGRYNFTNEYIHNSLGGITQEQIQRSPEFAAFCDGYAGKGTWKQNPFRTPADQEFFFTLGAFAQRAQRTPHTANRPSIAQNPFPTEKVVYVDFRQ
ncbi:MAG: hypothetical protein OXR66_07305 [Candidatus Woesearchaeota archaeon]|nr:hypothetical protein [Candidatus Woesearchaeota archaeon]